MSNQTKFGLILGLGVILLVGIIVSDHLSQTKQGEITDNSGVLALHGEQNPGNMPDKIRDQFLYPAPISVVDAALGSPATRPSLVPVIAVYSPQSLPGAIQAGVGADGSAAISSPLPVAPAPGALIPAPLSPVAVVAHQAPVSRTYTVKNGDNLSIIAAKTLGSRNRWNEILTANKQALNAADNKLSIGMVLNVPGSTLGAACQVPAVATANPRTYVVQKGDLLGTIAAKQLGSSKRVKDLVDTNKKALPKGEKSMLNVGMTLILPAQ